MQRQNVIIMIYPDKEPICWGNFDDLENEFESARAEVFSRWFNTNLD
jgi:hypothetical protein